MGSGYDHRKIEPKWQQFWQKNKTFKAEDRSKKPKYYALDMFPYPSSAGLHVGHPLGYTATDIVARYMRMKGYNVLHPMGWDAFGLPAENYAIKTKVHPEKTTQESIATFRRQIQELGFSYDWNREINTSAAKYYRWTQWFFGFLYQNNLAYRKKAPVNWCPSCQTVLANEQVINGHCERCKHEVVQKELEQWFFKIREFIEDQGKTLGLLSGLEKIDWPESTKIAQENWIGKSEGAEIDFEISKNKVIVYTTRPDTIFGATYLVLSPEHPLASRIASKEQKSEVEKYIAKALKKTELERQESKEKTGIFTGAYTKNPANEELIPVWIADYVLMSYGTGAIMAVPAHDERDFEFAQKYKIPIKKVAASHWMTKEIFSEEIIREKLFYDTELSSSSDGVSLIGQNIEGKSYWGLCGRNLELLNKAIRKYLSDKKMTLELWHENPPYSNLGVVINSQFLNDLSTEQAKEKMIQWLEEKRIGRRKMNYKLRDWLVSRQRYWGAPIPVVYDGQGDHYLLPDDELPVHLPHDVDFMPTGESPLTKSRSFHDPKDLQRVEKKLKKSGVLPKDRTLVRRESDTMDTFVCSSWYMFRFMDPRNEKEFASSELMNTWGPIDLYVGGAEHTVLHLLYARFFTKALHRHGYINYDEPFAKLRHQGMILGEDGQKMSKSRGNVINPDEIIGAFGADTLRCYEMFMGPFDQKKPWSTGGVEGIRRFLDRVYRVFQKPLPKKDPPVEVLRILHQTIKIVTKDIEEFQFNTALSQLMILTNELTQVGEIPREILEDFVLLLSPFAPHLAAEMWTEVLGRKEEIAFTPWPKYDPKYLVETNVIYAVQVNGKVRGDFSIAKDATKEEVIAMAKTLPGVQRHLEGKEIVKEVFVPGKIVGFVVE